MSYRLALAMGAVSIAVLGGKGVAAQDTGHSFDMTIDPAAISETQRLGPRSFSPYANRAFPTRPLWGDQHVHTGWSFDAGFINGLSPEDALRFARGEQVMSTFGVPVQLSRPLDWLAMTDHSDLLGVTAAVRGGDPALMEDETLARWSGEMAAGIERAVSAAMEAIQMQGEGTLPEAAQLPEFFERSWHDYTEIIERFNEPGRFSAMIGYEWTPNPGPGNNLHRNVIYRGDKLEADRKVPFTTFDSVDPEDLWEWMGAYEEETGGQVLAIPHNGNLSNGLMFAFETYGSEPLTLDYALRRQRWEPLYEVTQIKGDGEAHPLLSPDDAFADFETWDEGNLNLIPKEEGMIEHEYAREALKNGLLLEAKLGANPFKFGLAGGTDTHTALTTAEEDNFFGKHSGVEPSPQRWEHVTLAFGDRQILGWQHGRRSAGLPSGPPRTPARRSGMRCSATRSTPRAARASWCASSAAGTSRPRTPAAAQPGRIGYDKGVPMGGDLPAAPGGARPDLPGRRSHATRSAAISTVSRSSRAGWMPTARRMSRSTTSPGRATASRGRTASCPPSATPSMSPTPPGPTPSARRS